MSDANPPQFRNKNAAIPSLCAFIVWGHCVIAQNTTKPRLDLLLSTIESLQ